MELHVSTMAEFLSLKKYEHVLKLLGGKKIEEEGEAGNVQ